MLTTSPQPRGVPPGGHVIDLAWLSTRAFKSYLLVAASSATDVSSFRPRRPRAGAGICLLRDWEARPRAGGASRAILRSCSSLLREIDLTFKSQALAAILAA